MPRNPSVESRFSLRKGVKFTGWRVKILAFAPPPWPAKSRRSAVYAQLRLKWFSCRPFVRRFPSAPPHLLASLLCMKRRKDRRRTTKVIDSCPNEIFTYANGVLSAYLALVLATYSSASAFYTTGMMTLRATRERNTACLRSSFFPKKIDK